MKQIAASDAKKAKNEIVTIFRNPSFLILDIASNGKPAIKTTGTPVAISCGPLKIIIGIPTTINSTEKIHIAIEVSSFQTIRHILPNTPAIKRIRTKGT